MYTIIEDCSPYYIRFTHPGIEEVINTCLDLTKDVDFVKHAAHADGFTQYKPPVPEAKYLLSKIPMLKQFDNFAIDRVALFVTQPGRFYKAHKDGPCDRISINYTIKILDDTCVTSWYSDEELKEYKVEGHDWYWTSRECAGFDKNSSTRHTPLKSMTAVAGECILFNTDIWHTFDNSRSTHERIVLTFRLQDPGVHYFADVKKTLFGI